jgi:hypothetical protein
MARYLTPNSLKQLCGKDGGFTCTIRAFRREIIEGRPNLVMYIEEDVRGIIVHRKLYEDLCAELGPPPAEVAEFFAREGLQ